MSTVTLEEAQARLPQRIERLPAFIVALSPAARKPWRGTFSRRNTWRGHFLA